MHQAGCSIDAPATLYVLCAVQVCLWVGRQPQACHYTISWHVLKWEAVSSRVLHIVGKEIDWASSEGARCRFLATFKTCSLPHALFRYYLPKGTTRVICGMLVTHTHKLDGWALASPLQCLAVGRCHVTGCTICEIHLQGCIPAFDAGRVTTIISWDCISTHAKGPHPDQPQALQQHVHQGGSGSGLPRPNWCQPMVRYDGSHEGQFIVTCNK